MIIRGTLLSSEFYAILLFYYIFTTKKKNAAATTLVSLFHENVHFAMTSIQISKNGRHLGFSLLYFSYFLHVSKHRAALGQLVLQNRSILEEVLHSHARYRSVRSYSPTFSGMSQTFWVDCWRVSNNRHERRSTFR